MGKQSEGLALLRAGELCFPEDRPLMLWMDALDPMQVEPYKPPHIWDWEGFVIRLVVALFVAHHKRDMGMAKPRPWSFTDYGPDAPSITQPTHYAIMESRPVARMWDAGDPPTEERIRWRHYTTTPEANRD